MARPTRFFTEPACAAALCPRVRAMRASSSSPITVALRGLSRRVLASYDGEAQTMGFPVAPANGDTFTIERGCRRTWNACCARRNWENFGGFLDLPYQAVVR